MSTPPSLDRFHATERCLLQLNDARYHVAFVPERLWDAGRALGAAHGGEVTDLAIRAAALQQDIAAAHARVEAQRVHLRGVVNQEWNDAQQASEEEVKR